MLGDDSENMDSMNDSYNDLIDDAASEDTDIFEFLDGSNVTSGQSCIVRSYSQ
jgi:hypothetical protein